MSIRALARDLYRAQQRVDQFRRELAAASGEEHVALAASLREAEQELRMLRGMLDGEKASGEFRLRHQTMGKLRGR
ncbi:MAG: hypothetical protein V2I32_00495 [Desulforhopalus sp.]|jgi:hypothetical protein|nr:hypothetical protein [Desulforhopalus sp.]